MFILRRNRNFYFLKKLLKEFVLVDTTGELLLLLLVDYYSDDNCICTLRNQYRLSKREREIAFHFFCL